MSYHICPCCGSRYEDLGWANNERDRPRIEAIERKCKSLGHKISDGPKYEVDEETRIRNQYKGYENLVGCAICKYIYRYDSSD